MQQLLNDNELPAGFDYPDDFKRIIAQDLIDFDPWIIPEGDRLRMHLEELKLVILCVN